MYLSIYKSKVFHPVMTAIVFLSFQPSHSCSPTTNVALNKTATASSIQNSSFPASSAVDGNSSTRWSSQFSDPQWIYVDLGVSQTVGKVILNWENAYAIAYKIDISSDAATWVTVASIINGNGGKNEIYFPATQCRYVRMYGTQRATGYGYSIWDFEVYPGDTATNTGLWVINGTKIYYNAGNVGIGRTDPQEKLDVNGSITAGGAGYRIYLRSNVLATNRNNNINPRFYYEGLISGNGDGTNSSDLLWGLHINALPFTYGQDNIYYHAGSHIFYTCDMDTNGNAGGESAKMTIGSNGNVAIGTAPTNYKLKVQGDCGISNNLIVSGKIFSKEMIVTLSQPSKGWPDYVFSKDYKAKDLEQLEKFIKKNGHLPGMPNKEQVTENGINLGDMQTGLLEKVEELTLFIIEMKKENEILKNKVTELEKKMKQ